MNEFQTSTKSSIPEYDIKSISGALMQKLHYL